LNARARDVLTAIAADMITLRGIRHAHHDQLLAECASAVRPARGEVLQLDVQDRDGAPAAPSTLWRVVSVTVHVPSLRSQQPADGSALAVRVAEVAVLPDSDLPVANVMRARAALSESIL
jgi:hypothetical protein